MSGGLKTFMPMSFPATIGFEAAGVVEEVGGEVAGFEKGDAVWTDATTGCYAQFVAVPAEKIGRAPINLSAGEAAVVPLAGLTSLQALRVVGARAGSKVLVLEGSGGTGSSAVRSPRAWGAMSPPRALDATWSSSSLGADHVVNYARPCGGRSSRISTRSTTAWGRRTSTRMRSSC